MRPRTNSGHSLSRFSVPLLPKPHVQDAAVNGVRQTLCRHQEQTIRFPQDLQPFARGRPKKS